MVGMVFFILVRTVDRQYTQTLTGARLPHPTSFAQRIAPSTALGAERISAASTRRGQITIASGLTAAERASVLRHELVHRWFTPLGNGVVQGARQQLGMWGYNSSYLLRFAEEALAEGVATGSITQRLAYPTAAGEVTIGGVVAEGAALWRRRHGAVRIRRNDRHRMTRRTMPLFPLFARITEQEALAIARTECASHKWPWTEPVFVRRELLSSWIRTNADNRGGNVNVRISARTGRIVKAAFAPR
jgi:hypothetical protein